MSESLVVREGQSSVIEVKGILDVETVGGLRDEGLELMAGIEEPVFDLSASVIRGSAGVALLIAWERSASEAGKRVRFINTPASLAAIAEACGVDELLSFD